jgi:hypothetical protein
MGEPLHIALGESAEACLSAACRAHGIPGTALGIPDDLSHGPLDDGRARMDYMRGCFLGYADWPFQATDAFLPWRAMLERIETAAPTAVLIWSGDNVSEATFLAMVCWWLRTRSEPLLPVAVPGTDDRYHVALQSPTELADLVTSPQELMQSERADLSEEFVLAPSKRGRSPVNCGQAPVPVYVSVTHSGQWRCHQEFPHCPSGGHSL